MKLVIRKRTRIYLLMLFIVTLAQDDICNAQINNYTSNKGIIKASDERIKILVDTGVSTRSGFGPISFPGVVGSLMMYVVKQSGLS
jgi:hypothetical protein